MTLQGTQEDLLHPFNSLKSLSACVNTITQWVRFLFIKNAVGALEVQTLPAYHY